MQCIPLYVAAYNPIYCVHQYRRSFKNYEKFMLDFRKTKTQCNKKWIEHKETLKNWKKKFWKLFQRTPKISFVRQVCASLAFDCFTFSLLSLSLSFSALTAITFLFIYIFSVLGFLLIKFIFMYVVLEQQFSIDGFYHSIFSNFIYSSK